MSIILFSNPEVVSGSHRAGKEEIFDRQNFNHQVGRQNPDINMVGISITSRILRIIASWNLTLITSNVIISLQQGLLTLVKSAAILISGTDG